MFKRLWNRYRLVKCIECRRRKFNYKIIYARPNRHMCSPNKARFTVPYCSDKCKKKRDRDRLLFFAELDKNCSDCIHFQHHLYIKTVRKGICLKKNITIKTSPLQPMGKSCFEIRYKETACQHIDQIPQ